MDALELLTLVVLVVLLLVTLSLLILAIIIQRARRPYCHIPCPPYKNYFLGHFLEIAQWAQATPVATNRFKDNINEPLFNDMMIQWHEQYGDTFMFCIFHKVVLVTRSQDALNTILVHGDPCQFTKSDFLPFRYMFNERYFGDGVSVVVDHKLWLPRRKLWDQFFSRQKLQEYVEKHNCSANLLVKELQTHADSGDIIHLSDYLELATLDSLLRAIFSVNMTSLHTDYHHKLRSYIVSSFAAVQAVLASRMMPLFFTDTKKKTLKLVREFRQTGKDFVRNREAELKSGKSVPDDVLTAILKAKENPEQSGYGEEEPIDDYIAVLVAGVETSANTLGILLLELGRRPDLMKQLVSEVDRVCGNKSNLTATEISNLQFMDMCIKETIRLYPSAPSIVREIHKQCTLDGYSVPGDTLVLISFIACNRNKNVVNEADVFNPDRFGPDQVSKIPAYNNMAFSIGQRSCIGKIYSQVYTEAIEVTVSAHVGNPKILNPKSPSLFLDVNEDDLGQDHTEF